MNTETGIKDLNFCETVFESVSEQIADADISLPDYCEDIVRVLNCEAVPNVGAVTVGDGHITLDGDVTVRIIYSGPDNKICAFERAVPFRKTAENSAIDKSCAVDVRLSSGFVNCRAVGPRRLDVHASVACSFKAEKKRTEKILSFAKGGGILCKTEEVKTTDFTGKTVRLFPMSETAELDDTHSAISSVVGVSSSVQAGDIKVINDKMLIKGELCVTVNYLGENGCFESFTHSMPISQIMELDGLNDTDNYILSAEPAGIEALPALDNNGKNRRIELSAKIRTSLYACRETEITLVTDAYSTEYEPELKTKGLETQRQADCFTESFDTRCTFDPGAVMPDTVLFVQTSEPAFDCSVKGNKAVVAGTFEAGVLVKSAAGDVDYIKKTVAFDYTRNTALSTGRAKTDCNVKIIACSCAVTADSKLVINAELQCTCTVFSTETVKCINEIIIDENKKANRSSALTVCFCDGSESIWSIAKKYRSTVEAVMEENSLGSDEITEGMMLVIPGV